MHIAKILEEKISQVLYPIHLEIMDQSHLHSGHMGMPDNPAETHFKICIVSDHFQNLTRLERHRYVHTLLKEELQYIHALSLTLLTKAEYKQNEDEK